MYKVQKPEEQERITYLVTKKESLEKELDILRKELLPLIYKLESK